MIRPLRLDELERAGRLAAAAFQDDSAWVHIFPDAGERRRRLPLILSTAFELDLAHGGRINVYEEDGRMLGLASFLEPERHGAGVLPWLLKAPQLWPPGSWAWRAVELLRAVERLRPMKLHYLKMLTVLPEAQGKGVGTALIASIPTPLFLETFMHRNVEYYEKRGFRIVAQTQSPVRPTFWSMLMKAPRSTGSAV